MQKVVMGRGGREAVGKGRFGETHALTHRQRPGHNLGPAWRLQGHQGETGIQETFQSIPSWSSYQEELGRGHWAAQAEGRRGSECGWGLRRREEQQQGDREMKPWGETEAQETWEAYGGKVLAQQGKVGRDLVLMNLL